MAFTVETGTGLTTSNSYTSVATADSYFSDRGSIVWAALADADKQVALIKATDYIDNAFRFIGSKASLAQALQWPRLCAYDPDGFLITGIPPVLEKACCEYAIRAASTELAPDPVYTDTGSLVTMEKDQVGLISEEKRYADRQPQIMRAYPMADALLRHLTMPKGSITRG